MHLKSLPAAIPLLVLAAAPASVSAYDFEDWPVHYVFADGTDLGLTGVYRYDVNEFSGDRKPDGTRAFEDSHTNRRKELGATLKKKGVYDAVVAYEYQSRTWQDVNLRLHSKAFLGADYGAFRFGYSKTPVSFEGVTSSKATTFLELALPAQAIFEGRRTGIDWQFERDAYIANVGYYWGQDLLGDNDGRTIAGRFAWTPRKAAGDVLHLGLAASREDRDGTTDGRGVYTAPTARFSTPPEAGLTPVRLVDSGRLGDVEDIVRNGVEALWIRGPWSVQGEWLRAQLTWTSPRGGLFMFISANGLAHSMTRRTLEKLLGKDALRIISRGGVVEGALDAVAQQALRNAQEADPDTGL